MASRSAVYPRGTRPSGLVGEKRRVYMERVAGVFPAHLPRCDYRFNETSVTTSAYTDIRLPKLGMPCPNYWTLIEISHIVELFKMAAFSGNRTSGTSKVARVPQSGGI